MCSYCDEIRAREGFQPLVVTDTCWCGELASMKVEITNLRLEEGDSKTLCNTHYLQYLESVIHLIHTRPEREKKYHGWRQIISVMQGNV